MYVWKETKSKSHLCWFFWLFSNICFFCKLLDTIISRRLKTTWMKQSEIAHVHNEATARDEGSQADLVARQKGWEPPACVCSHTHGGHPIYFHLTVRRFTGKACKGSAPRWPDQPEGAPTAATRTSFPFTVYNAVCFHRPQPKTPQHLKKWYENGHKWPLIHMHTLHFPSKYHHLRRFSCIVPRHCAGRCLPP